MLSKRDLLIGKELKRDEKNPSWFNCDRINIWIDPTSCVFSIVKLWHEDTWDRKFTI